MNSAPLWFETASIPTYPPLSGDAEVDVLVVGGGVAGLTGALLLQRAGRRVVLIEARRLGAGETGHSTAHLTELLDARYHALEAKFGRDGARAAAESSRAAIDRIQAFIAELGDPCGFARVPAYLYAETETQRQELDRELESLQRAGCDAALSDSCPLPFPVLGAVRVERQAQLHPIAYLRELADRFVAAGGVIHEDTRMLDVGDGEPCTVVSNHGTLRANAVLVMTNQPTASRFALHTKIAAYRSYALAVRLERLFPPGLFFDLAEPYHYLRAQATDSGPVLLVGGEDHKTGKVDPDVDPAAHFAMLEAYARDRFAVSEVSHRWSGQIVEPSDGLPFIGRNSGDKHVYVATGFSGTGITFGTLSGMILTDAVLGVANPWAELYQATRIKPLAQVREYVAENLDFPVTLARDRLARGEVASVAEVPRGEGRLVRQQGKMLAVYRGEDGAVAARSAVCTHLGCHVHWNNAADSWDCPCHGSRFGVDGEVINGPATRALAEIDVELDDRERDAPAAAAAEGDEIGDARTA